ncbi:MAG: hypothetical protein Q8L72_09465 [Moraxellaceae bacterium]|nr:hypothetical protein [Moraxellaceae bacterium]
MVESRRMQLKLAMIFVVAFVLLLILLALSAPTPQHFKERVLVGLMQTESNLLDDDFGGFPDLVKDLGGTEPTPFSPDWLPHPQFRDGGWLLARSPVLYTLQIGVFTSQDGIKNLLAERTDSDRFAFVHVRDPAYREEPLVPMIVDGELVPSIRSEPPKRYILTFGEFSTVADAQGAAESLMGLPGRPVVRSWDLLQALYVPKQAVPKVDAVEVVRPGTEVQQVRPADADSSSAEPVGAETQERTIPVLSLPFR